MALDGDSILTGHIVDAAMRVHRRLGPSVFESAYEACLTYELHKRGMRARTQVPVPIEYDGLHFELGYRIDMLVEECVVVELKVVAKLLPVHDAQVISYLRLGGYRVGLPMNFHSPRLKDGIRRFVNHA